MADNDDASHGLASPFRQAARRPEPAGEVESPEDALLRKSSRLLKWSLILAACTCGNPLALAAAAVAWGVRHRLPLQMNKAQVGFAIAKAFFVGGLLFPVVLLVLAVIPSESEPARLRANVTRTSGAAPVTAGQECSLEVYPGRYIENFCQATLQCGSETLYANDINCESGESGVEKARDPHFDDGDPLLLLDVPQGRLEAKTATWAVDFQIAP